MRAVDAEADVAADRVGEQERVLRDDAHLRAQCAQRPIARVDAVDEDAPARRVVEARDHVDERRFAGAGLAEDAEARAGRDREVDVGQDRRLRVVGEREVDVFEADRAVDMVGHRRHARRRTFGDGRNGRNGRAIVVGGLRLPDARRRREQTADLDAGGVEALPVVDEPAGLADRGVDHPQIRVEGDEAAERHVALEHEEAAERDRDQLQREAEAVEPRHIAARVARHVHVALHVVVVAFVELLRLVVLADEGLDDAVAFDVLLDHRIHRCERIADREEQRLRMLRQLAREHEQERRDAGERQREPPVDRRHHDERTDEHDDAVDRLIAHPAEQMADRVGVRRHAAHDVAGARVVEVVEVERVQLLVFVADETEDGVLPEALHPHRVAVVGGVAHDCDDDHQDA